MSLSFEAIITTVHSSYEIMPRRRSRYTGVLRSGNNQARGLLLSYFDGDRQVEYVNRQGNRAPTRDIWVRPFNLGIDPNMGLRQSVNAERFPLVQSFFLNFSFLTPPPVSFQLIAPRLLADRVVITVNRSNSGGRRTSQLTGKNYLSYGGDGLVVPFGRASIAMLEGPAQAFESITGRAVNANPLNQTTFIPSNWS